MAAPAGNKFWLLRSSHGRNPIFPSPDALEKACQEYFDFCVENPLEEEKLFCNKDGIHRATIYKMRIFTKIGLCNFLCIGTSTWEDYKNREDFSAICARVELIIRQQGIEGSAAGQLDPGITARVLGLAEKRELTGKEGGPIEQKTTMEAGPGLRGVLSALAAASTSGPDGSGTGGDPS